MRIYDNPNHLMRSVVERRLQILDSTATANPYAVEREDHSLCYYVGVDSTLTDVQIESNLGPMTQTDVDAEEDDIALRDFQKQIRIHCKRIEDESKARDKYIRDRQEHLVDWLKTNLGYPGYPS